MKSLLILVVFLATANGAFALPRFSILPGMRCTGCHTNPTGGELRNSFGSSDFADDHLRLVPAHGDSTDYNFNPQLNDYILLGGDVRFQYLYDGDQKKTTFQSMEGSIYSLLRLFTSTDLFVKYDFANTAYEAYGLYKFNSDNSYVKVGAFEPSYGIRLDDHTAFTRGGNFGTLQGLAPAGYSLIFSPDYWDAGIEVGSRFDNLFVTVDATNGAGPAPLNFDSKKAFIGKAEYLMKGNFMIGVSGYSAGSLTMYGAQAGAGIGERLTTLGELDWANSLPGVIHDYPNAKSNAAFVEITCFVTNGLSGTGRFDYFRTVAGGPIYERYVFGADIYPIPHIDLMPQIRFNLNNVKGEKRPVEALIQSHIYF